MNQVEKYTKYAPYLDFIDRYQNAHNAADGSERDANANVENKNITTMEGEVFKGDFVGVNRLAMWRQIRDMYGEELAEEYIRQLEEHEIYRHDETALIGKPYTYSAQEAIVVKTPQGIKLTSFEELYDMCTEPSVVVDAKNRVSQKHPVDWYVLDRNGFTPIQTITKKQRHRDLVRVKTRFGEDVIVTDNHPMIIDDDPANTVEAIAAEGFRQYRCPWDDSTLNAVIRPTIDFTHGEDYNLYTVLKKGDCNFVSAPNMKMDADLGYFIGFFVARGWFTTPSRTRASSMMIIAKETEDLLRCSDALFRSTGIAATIQEHEDLRGMRTLKVNHPDFVDYCLNNMRLGRKAHDKKCPIDILSYPREFRIGFICGLIDGNGTVNAHGTALISLNSRTCISQLSYVLRSLGVPASMMYDDFSEDEKALVWPSYPLFGISFPLGDMFEKSRKNNGARPRFSKYRTGWSDVRFVMAIDNEHYLKANEFIYDITTKTHTFVLNNIWVHNCVSATMYPFLFHGLTSVGGLSEAPTNVHSFIGGLINLVFVIASQFAGAVSTPEFLPYMDYFLRKEYGEDYYLRADEVVDLSLKRRTIRRVIEDLFQQIVYSLNQPAAARNSQSVFWNIAYFDKPYFEGMFQDFVFPDGSSMVWESTSWLQELFMEWFNKERTRKILTFPVETVNLLNNGREFLDPHWKEKAAEMWAKGHSFFCYTSDSVDSLSSCCRLKNEIQENTFSFTLGAGGVSTGSKCVMTMNVNRLVQNAVRSGVPIEQAVAEQTEKLHKYLLAFNEILKTRLKNHMLPIYEAGFISLDKQYLTLGINGFVEGAEFLGIDISPDNPAYLEYGEKILKPIYDLNRRDKDRGNGVMFNTEMVPGRPYSGHLKFLLIDLELPCGQQGASVKAA